MTNKILDIGNSFEDILMIRMKLIKTDLEAVKQTISDHLAKPKPSVYRKWSLTKFVSFGGKNLCHFGRNRSAGSNIRSRTVGNITRVSFPNGFKRRMSNIGSSLFVFYFVD